MTEPNPESDSFFIETSELDQLIQFLIEEGYQVVGPVVQDNAIVYGPIGSINDLPRGWTDDQSPGSYRLKQREDDALFGYAVGPHSWKQFLFPPRTNLSEATRSEDGWEFGTGEAEVPKFAFLGVRACELAAIQIQDRVFINDAWADPVYQSRRQSAVVIAVNCTMAASTCFCSSMNSGPKCSSGFDLALTELSDGFVIDSGSDVGGQLLDKLAHRNASTEEADDAEARRENAVNEITKQMHTQGLRDLLFSNLDHPRWDAVAERCLSCTNCTMVCPTCFCNSVTEVTDLTGDNVTRVREWDSCFNPGFSYIAGGNVRDNVRSRYRQWLTHKLGSWIDQFGTSGCVGCGRCITWCPVGIDLTEEVTAIQEDPQ